MILYQTRPKFLGHAGLLLLSALLLACGETRAASQTYPLETTLYPAPTVGPFGGQHGYAVAANDVYTVVGAPNSGFGLVTIYSTASGAVLARLDNPVRGQHSDFGSALAVSGTRALIGGGGAARVYDLSGPEPVVVARLENPGADNFDFGMAVAISGNRAAVGNANGTGVVHLYDLAGSAPGLATRTIANPTPTPEDDERFGGALALAGDRLVTRASFAGQRTGEVYVYDLSAGGPAGPVATLTSPEPVFDGLFGHSLALSGNRLAVGEPLRPGDLSGLHAGVVHVFDLSTPGTPPLTLRAPAPGAEQRFGVALSAWGDYLAAGEFIGKGVVHLFDLAHPLTPPRTVANPRPLGEDQFGLALALTETRLVAGQVSSGDNDDGPVDRGSAWLFSLAAGNAQPAVISALTTSGVATADQFGYRMAASGNRVAVAAIADDAGGENAGAVYVYDLSNPAADRGRLAIRNPGSQPYSMFGSSVALSGSRLAVGETGLFSLHEVMVYNLDGPTPTEPILSLRSPDDLGYFGSASAMEGDMLVVGALYSDAAYVYNLLGTTPTIPMATLPDPAPRAEGYFGSSVAISGTRVAVGESQAVYVYDLAAATPGIPVLTLPNPAPDEARQFGNSVALSGNRLVVGSRLASGARTAGRVYVYDLQTGSTAPWRTLRYPLLSDGDELGAAVAISGNRVVAGISTDDTPEQNSGRAYVYDLAAAPDAEPILLRNPTPAWFDYFGSAVALSGGKVIVGAHLDGTLAYEEGAAYVFTDTPVSLLSEDLNAALETTGLVWTLGGQGRAAVEVGDAGDALVFRDLSSGQEAWVETTLTGPGTVVFGAFGPKFQTGYATLDLLVDGVDRDAFGSGYVQGPVWLQAAIPAGNHTVRWRLSAQNYWGPLFGERWVELRSAAFLPGPAAPVTGGGGSRPPAPLLWVEEGRVSSPGVFFPALAAGETSWMDTVVTGPARVEFRWRSHAETFCLVDGRKAAATLREQYSQTDHPLRQRLEIPAGPHTLRWQGGAATAELSGLTISPGSEIAGLFPEGRHPPVIWRGLNAPDDYSHLWVADPAQQALGGGDRTYGGFWVTGPALLTFESKTSVEGQSLAVVAGPNAVYLTESAGLRWQPKGLVIPPGEQEVRFDITEDDSTLAPYIWVRNIQIIVGGAYPAWAAAYGIHSGPEADEDGDGVKNLLEFSLNQDPISPSPLVLPEIIIGAGDRRMTLPALAHDAAGLTYKLQVSPDLATWTTAATAVASPPGQPGPTLILPRAPGRPREFVRLAVELEGLP